jgi:hypothetical protein
MDDEDDDDDILFDVDISAAHGNAVRSSCLTASGSPQRDLRLSSASGKQH